MLVQDAEAVFAAAVVSVHCGYVDDPQDLAGLSHFLEHAVHLGSAKYPQERGYKHFLSQVREERDHAPTGARGRFRGRQRPMASQTLRHRFWAPCYRLLPPRQQQHTGAQQLTRPRMRLVAVAP